MKRRELSTILIILGLVIAVTSLITMIGLFGPVYIPEGETPIFVPGKVTIGNIVGLVIGIVLLIAGLLLRL